LPQNVKGRIQPRATEKKMLIGVNDIEDERMVLPLVIPFKVSV
jgi:hypothetical protein